MNELIRANCAKRSVCKYSPGTRLKDIKIEDGLATVDFTESIQSKHPGFGGRIPDHRFHCQHFDPVSIRAGSPNTRGRKGC